MGLLFALVFSSGCATSTSGPSALPDRVFTGHLITAERANWFRPCGAEAQDPFLWVTFTDRSVAQIAAARADGVALVGDTAFVLWRAVETDERMVGPGGPALLVRDITVVRPAGSGDCAPSAP